MFAIVNKRNVVPGVADELYPQIHFFLPSLRNVRLIQLELAWGNDFQVYLYKFR